MRFFMKEYMKYIWNFTMFGRYCFRIFAHSLRILTPVPAAG